MADVAAIVTLRMDDDVRRMFAEVRADVERVAEENARLGEALAYARDIIANYELEMRATPVAQYRDEIPADDQDATLADLGFCQGRIYRGALARLADLAKGGDA